MTIIKIAAIDKVRCTLSSCIKGSNRLEGGWWGTNTLNDAIILKSLFLSNLNNTWWVPSSGNKYLTEKSPSGMLIFSNLNNLCPFVTTTLNINSVNSSITGLLGSSVNWIKILYFWLIQFWIASPDRMGLREIRVVTWNYVN